MFGIFAHGNVHPTVVHHRIGEELISVGSAGQHVLGGFWITIKFPEDFGLAVAIPLGIETIDPTIAGREDNLRLAADHGISR